MSVEIVAKGSSYHSICIDYISLSVPQAQIHSIPIFLSQSDTQNGLLQLFNLILKANLIRCKRAQLPLPIIINNDTFNHIIWLSRPRPLTNLQYFHQLLMFGLPPQDCILGRKQCLE